MKNTHITIFLFVLIALLSACKKYEENPLINLRLKETRMKGKYTLASYFVNGVDSTNAVNTMIAAVSPNNEPYNLIFSVDDNQGIFSGTFGGGEWEFRDHKTKVWIFKPRGIYPTPMVFSKGLSWTITKLTDRHIHLQVDYNGSNYYVQLHEQ
jgi:hypothetical protein